MEDVIFAGHLVARSAGPRRGHRHHRQLRQRVADRVLRGVDHPADVPRRSQRVRNQRQQLPFDGCPGAAERLRHRPRDARHRRAGQAQRDPRIATGRSSGIHRGSRRCAQTPQAQGKGRPQARVDVGEPGPADRPDHRTAPPAQTAWAAKPKWPVGPKPSRPICATPGCGWPPTTWSPDSPSSTTPTRPRRRCAASTTRPRPGWRWRPRNWPPTKRR